MVDSKLTSPLLVAQHAATLQPIRPVPTTGKPIDLAAAQEAAQDFEAVFLSQMLSHMFTALPTDGPFGGGQAESTYRSMLVNEYGRLIARAGGLGMSSQVMAEILKLQEESLS